MSRKASILLYKRMLYVKILSNTSEYDDKQFHRAESLERNVCYGSVAARNQEWLC
jgi:hypothetical protein